MKSMITLAMTLALGLAFAHEARCDEHEGHKNMKKEHEQAHLQHDRWMAENSK